MKVSPGLSLILAEEIFLSLISGKMDWKIRQTMERDDAQRN